MDSSPWLGPAWCFEFSSRRCSGSSKNLRRGAHASARSQTTKEGSSYRTIGTAIHHNLPRRREVLIHKNSTPPNPPLFGDGRNLSIPGGRYTRDRFSPAVQSWASCNARQHPDRVISTSESAFVLCGPPLRRLAALFKNEPSRMNVRIKGEVTSDSALGWFGCTESEAKPEEFCGVPPQDARNLAARHLWR